MMKLDLATIEIADKLRDQARNLESYSHNIEVVAKYIRSLAEDKWRELALENARLRTFTSPQPVQLLKLCVNLRRI